MRQPLPLLFWMLWFIASCGDGKTQNPSNNSNNNNINNTTNNTNNHINNINNINNSNNTNNHSIIDPGDPGPADIRVFVDAAAPRWAISPWIYGMNMGGPDALPKTHIPFWRIGGNRWTAYNWENNASNAGSDWYYQNDDYLGGGETPGEAVAARVRLALSDPNARVMVTLAMAGRVAADTAGPVAGDGSEAESARFRDACPQKPGGAFTYPPVLTDACVHQDELVHWLLGEFAPDAGRIVFSLDNEPDLWAYTHREIHPEPATYAELEEKSVTLAAAVRAVAPNAEIYGYAGYGYAGFINLQDAPDAAENGIFIDHFLQAFARAENERSTRLLDVLDIHWYPEARGGGRRITQDDGDDILAEARMQAPRSLWDPEYMEDSWIARDAIGGPIQLLPWLAGRIEANRPGTKLSISEYYYGGGAHISGAIAQADVLGIFGREGLWAASLWHLGSTDDAFIHAAFDLYLNYDGNGARFGDQGIAVTVSDTETFSAYAAKRTGIEYETHVILINKRSQPVTVSVRARDTQEFAFGRVWQITDAAPAPVPAANFSITTINAGIITLPARSVTLVVLMPPL